MEGHDVNLKDIAGNTGASFRLRLSGILHLLFLFVLLHLGHSGAAQGRVSISADHADIFTVLKSIEEQTGYHFWAEDGALALAKPVTLQVGSVSLSKALELTFQDQPLTYKIVDRIIVIKRAGPSPGLTLTGIVLAGAEPLENASVVVLQTQKGTATNHRGIFRLDAVSKGSTLAISCVGFQSQQLTVHTDSPVTVILTSAEKQLDAPVIVAYGVSSQRTSTAHINTMSSVQVDRQPVSNALLAIEGVLPGIFVQQVTGTTGGQMNVQIGGRNSIASGNDPLYIIDGIPFPSTSLVQTGYIINQGSPLQFLAPQDIEAITVLKDAMSTAIYGSRGAGGVVLITTRKPKAGEGTGFAITSTAGASTICRRMPLLTTSPYLQMRHEAFANDQATPDPAADFDMLAWDTTRNTDWQKTLIGRIAPQREERLSFHRSGTHLRVQASAGYKKEGTVMPGDFHTERATAHGSLVYQSPNNRLTLALSLNASRLHYLLPTDDPTINAITLPPDGPPGYLEDGSYNWTPGYNNPFATLANIYKASGSTFNGTAQLAYALWPGLRLKLNMGGTTEVLTEKNPKPVNAINPAYGITSGSTSFADAHIQSWTMEPMLEYSHLYNDLKIVLLAGGTFHRTVNTNLLQLATGYTDPTQLESIGAAAAVDTLTNQYFDYRYVSVYGRARLELKGRYIAELTGRRDGSSRFGPNKQFATFGAAGLAWIMSSEPWWKDRLGILSFAKLGLTYGSTGNDEIGDYQYQTRWINVRYPYGGQQALVPQQLNNGDYSWELSKRLNVSFDVGLLKDRVQFSATYYRSQTTQTLLTVPISSVTGFQSLTANTGAAITNRSWEFTANATILNEASLQWTMYFNLTIPKNRLVRLPEIGLTTYQNYLEVGKSLGVFKAYHYLGVDGATGTYLFKDIDHDGQISYPNDLAANKSLDQSFYGGLGTGLSYKNLSLHLLFQCVKQSGFNYLALSSYPPGSIGNQPKWVFSRWTTPGQQASIQKFTQEQQSAATAAFFNLISSDAIISDASYLRMKNIVLEYIRPIKRKHVKAPLQARFFFQILNLFTITQYKGVDPETLSGTSQAWLPPLRSYLIGTELKF